MRGVPVAARAVQHEAAVAVHRAAAQHDLRADLRTRRFEAHLLEDLVERHRQGLVDDDAERALLGAVFADERDGLGEIRVVERGHRDEQVVAEAVAVRHARSMRLQPPPPPASKRHS